MADLVVYEAVERVQVGGQQRELDAAILDRLARRCQLLGREQGADILIAGAPWISMKAGKSPRTSGGR